MASPDKSRNAPRDALADPTASDPRSGPSGPDDTLVTGSTSGGSGSEDDTRAASSGFTPRYVDQSEPRIEGYVLHDELHRGGQGIVYRALQIGTKREVALKVLLEGPFASDDARLRFEREIELAASLKHPNIVTILDSGVDHGRYYYAMEYIDGQRLGHYWKSRRPPMDETLRLFERICHAVNFAHQRGVIHRDLKPSNILVDSDGNPQIFDFGLAKPIQTPDSDQTTLHLLSTTGQVLGTIAYMSPEQAASPQDVDVRSDVYSLGVILYETLLGQSPYPVSGTLAEVLTHIAQTEPTSPHSVRTQSRFGSEVDDELSTILLKTLEKEPSRRYQTAGDLARDLERYRKGEPIEAKRASALYMFRKTLRRYRVHALVASVMLIMLVTSLIGFAVMYRRESGLRAVADRHRSIAVHNEKVAHQAQQRERDARQKAEAATARLRESLVRQRIQRGDLARQRGDLALARDAYWGAFQSTTSPEARWNLRRYYAETGEIASHQLYVNSMGQSAVSPNGELAATCNRIDSVSVHNVETGEALGWYPMPGPVSCLRIYDDGVLAVGGRGWLRLFGPKMLRPSLAIELPQDFTPDAIYFDADAARVFTLDARRVWTYQTAAGGSRDDLVLRGVRSGAAEYQSSLRRLAVPTTAGVQFISVDGQGRLQSELIWLTIDQPPRAVRFSGDDLLAVLSAGVDLIQLDGDQHGQTVPFLKPAGTWDMLDLRQGVGALVLGSHDGRVALYRSGMLQRTWRVTSGTLHDLSFADDGTLVTRDGSGSLTRWRIAGDSQQRRTLLDQVASDWAVSADGSTVVLLDATGHATRYRPADGHLTPLPTPDGARSSLSALGGSPDVSVSLSANGEQILFRSGARLSLSDAMDRQALWTATWSDSHSPNLKETLIAPDGTRIAIRAESPAGDRQLIAFYVATTPRHVSRRGARRGQLVPVRNPVTVGGSPIRLMTFFPGSSDLLMARANGDLATLSPGAAKLQTWVTLDSPATLLEFDPRSRYLAVADEDGVVQLFTLTGAEPKARFNIANEIAALDFSPDGEVLLVRSVDGTLRLFDLNTCEQILRWTLVGGGARPLAAWTGNDAIMLAHDGKVYEHRFDRTDQVMDANRRFPLQREIVRHIADGDFDAAWKTSLGLRDLDSASGSLAQEEILEMMLSRRSVSTPESWLSAVLTPDDARPLLRLGYAAYDGRRFGRALKWLRRGVELLNGRVDAYTLWRVGRCEYLQMDYTAAALSLAGLAMRPDFDAIDIPAAQLELTAALHMSGRPRQARQAGRRIGRWPQRVLQRRDPLSTISAANIGRFIAGDIGERSLVDSVSMLLGVFAEGSLDFHDDPYFFFGELDRQRGDRDGALGQYQHCIELARDEWPSNWARYRIEQMSSTGEPSE